MNVRWRALKKQLEARSGHDFERALLPLLRIRWPHLVHPKSLQYLDKVGIDQVLISDGNPLDVVIQCKGFEIIEPLGESQISQIRKSAEKFIASGFKTKLYVLIYNRFGADQTFETQVNDVLASITSKGIASTTQLWNLNTLATELSETLIEFLLGELAQKTHRKHEQERSRFSFGAVTITSVPFQEKRMQLQSHCAPQISDRNDIVCSDPLLRFPIDKRGMTLVVGRFGAGKSTLAYRLSDQLQGNLIYVPAAALTHVDNGTQSENSLVQAIVEYLGIFDDAVDLTAEQRKHLEYLAGPLLAARFRTPRSGLVLLIDAIDENRFYSSMKGFQILTNELARFQCAIVITTRLEHFIDSFETYTTPLGHLSPFGIKSLHILLLENWKPTQVLEYVNCAIANAREHVTEKPQPGSLGFSILLSAMKYQIWRLHTRSFLP